MADLIALLVYTAIALVSLVIVALSNKGGVGHNRVGTEPPPRPPTRVHKRR